jgi:hypothetical protein
VWHIQEVEGDDLRVGGRRTGARWPWSNDSTVDILIMHSVGTSHAAMHYENYA